MADHQQSLGESIDLFSHFADADAVAWGGTRREIRDAGADICGVEGRHLLVEIPSLTNQGETTTQAIHERLIQLWATNDRYSFEPLFDDRTNPGAGDEQPSRHGESSGPQTLGQSGASGDPASVDGRAD